MRNVLFIFILFSCTSTKINSPKEKMEDNQYDIDVSDIINKINKSNIKTLEIEKDKFLNSEYKNNVNYLNSLNKFIKNEVTYFDPNLLEKTLKTIFKKSKKDKLSEIYLIYMRYMGETLYDKVIVLVEESGSHSLTFYSFNNSSNDLKVKFINKDLAHLLEEYRQNINYSYNYKSDMYNYDPQHFFINKIRIDKGKVADIESTFVLKMLNYQVNIFETFFQKDFNAID